MSGRGPQTFKKRQKEQQRKEWQQEKVAKRLQRKLEGPLPEDPEADSLEVWASLAGPEREGGQDPQAPTAPVGTESISSTPRGPR
jgi:hypothetical protein